MTGPIGYGPTITIGHDRHGEPWTIDVRCCDRCGAVIAYTTVHDDWHSRVEGAPSPPVGVQSFKVDPPIDLVAGETAMIAVDYAAQTAVKVDPPVEVEPGDIVMVEAGGATLGFGGGPRVKVSPGECGVPGPDGLLCQRNAGHLTGIPHSAADVVSGELVKW